MLARLALVALHALYAAADTYAVLVAGSSGYENYRHQADVAHAYQILTKGGVKADNIVTMMYDDVASDPKNPFPGQLFNKPAATMAEANDVYASVKDHIDYKGNEVTPENFVAVLTGDSNATKGKKVLASGPDDVVFVNFVDHGAPMFIGFPNDIFMADNLTATFKAMHEKKMYKHLVFYLESCMSGGMFAKLPANINIYALAAAPFWESSWAQYCPVPGTKQGPKVGDVTFDTCLADRFSAAWMENADVTNLRFESLAAQYGVVVAKTLPNSLPTQHGALLLGLEPASVFEGTGRTALKNAGDAGAPGTYTSVDSRDVKLTMEFSRYMKAEGDAAARSAHAASLIAEIQHREAEDAKFAAIARALALPESLAVPEAEPEDVHCAHAAHKAVATRCGGYSDYSLKHAAVIAKACVHHHNAKKVVSGIETVCAKLRAWAHPAYPPVPSAPQY
eukprot:TRINITY_DN1163_c0_g4_i1.p1 TRINITY_DN1163_c0_g4~~TRINITY_DN1163_c0_g4_i1.p1  ORF type:complete len:451 (+),score=134.26 TRINITY_DN1163_c0_g4_i1:57-1409(+)